MLDTTVILIGALLAMFSVAVLAYPLMKSRPSGQPETPQLQGEDGFPELESIYESIRTLRLEYELGKVEENHYRQQMDDYRLLAAATLRRRDEQRADAGLRLEQDVLKARAALVSTDVDSNDIDSADGNSAGYNSIETSGRCSSCGLALGDKTVRCPHCAVSVGPDGPDPP